MKNYNGQAAVLIAITEDECGNELVLLTQRAEHLAIHSGEVAFPGGKWETYDSGLQDTALRESEEEVGLAPSRVDVINRLPASYTRGGMKVTPFVGRIDSPDGLVANDGELQSLFWVPVAFFLSDRRTRTDIFELNGQEYWAPVYDWNEYKVWGFTARVIVDFLNLAYDRSIEREHSAPEIKYSANQ